MKFNPQKIKDVIQNTYTNLSKRFGATPVIVTIVAFAVGSVGVTGGIISKSIEAAREAYENAEAQAENDAYHESFNSTYQRYQEKYQVSHEIYINVLDIQDLQRLESLKVTLVDYVTQDEKDEKEGIKYWCRMTGEGVFTVDLAAAEYLVDNERKIVSIRLNKPELTSFTIVDTENVFFHDKTITIPILNFDINDGSMAQGTELYSRITAKGSKQIREKILLNQSYFERASESTITTLENLVKNINSDVDGLQVEISFFE